MPVTSAQRALAIGLAVFVMSAVAAPSVAVAKNPLGRAQFQTVLPFRMSGSPLSGGVKRHKRSRFRMKSILRYSTTIELGDTDVTMRVRARLKPRSVFKFDILF